MTLHQRQDDIRGQEARSHAQKRGWQYDWLIWAVDTGIVATLKRSEPSVLCGLLRHANDKGHAWPSVDLLAAETGRGDRAVQMALQSLVEHQRQFLIRRGQGFANRSTATYIFQPFTPVTYRIDLDTTDEAHESAPVKRTNLHPGGANPFNQGRTNVRPNSGMNSKKEIVVDTRKPANDAKPNDDDVFSDPIQAEPCGLFDSHEAELALIAGFDFKPADARNQVKAFGHAAVMDAVKSIEFMRNHNVQVSGKPVRNWKGLLVRHLSTRMPEHPAVTEAAEKARKAEETRQKREQDEINELADKARKDQDAAMLQMILSGMTDQQREQIRDQIVATTANPMLARSYSRMPINHPILQDAIASYIINQPDKPAASRQPYCTLQDGNLTASR